MKKKWSRILIFLSKNKHNAYEFLKRHGFFEELVRGIVKLVFFIIIFRCFGQVVVW